MWFSRGFDFILPTGSASQYLITDTELNPNPLKYTGSFVFLVSQVSVIMMLGVKRLEAAIDLADIVRQVREQGKMVNMAVMFRPSPYRLKKCRRLNNYNSL